MTAPRSDLPSNDSPASASERSPYVWARSIEGALAAAQGLALAQLERLRALEMPTLTRGLRSAETHLRKGQLQRAAAVLEELRAGAEVPRLGALDELA